ncbi:hypothetical protein [uncultured Draconibacterium sp.]|uniref:hypothetical protein n=1 Tax=uncultured Draconibacterium sp. TaxID=1573823 RepID=UPI00321640F2
MFKQILFVFLFLSTLLHVQAQKKYINRKVAQKNYEGYMLMQENKFDSALILFDEAITDDPDAFFIYQNRAICKLNLQDTSGAISDYQTNIKLEPDNAESKYALGNIYKTRLDSVNALNYFVPAIEQADVEFSQKKLLYMNNFAGHYFRLNHDFDSALVFYERVKIYTPQNASVYINSAVCNFRLDSLQNFCSDLEQAFILGGSVNCIALKTYCKGCNHLIAERGKTDTLSTALDTRLAGIIPDTIYYHLSAGDNTRLRSFDTSRKIKIYFNELWQICIPEKASFYREAFWSKLSNYFGGDFTDYYSSGEIYATGRIEKKLIQGDYKVYYKNGNPKLKAHFINGNPAKKWTFFLDDGSIDYEVDIEFEEFKINILNKDNPNFAINSGTGEFSLLIDKWDNIEFIFSGEYVDNAREGQWAFIQNGEKVISEKYKKGKFKSGYVTTTIGNINSENSCITASIFTPPQITQVAGLYFVNAQAANYYSFIRKFGL